MDPTVVEYIGFVVAALILIWAVFELGKWRNSRRKVDLKTVNTWVKLDSTRPGPVEEALPHVDDDQEEMPAPSIHSPAKQNGHYSESKKPL